MQYDLLSGRKLLWGGWGGYGGGGSAAVASSAAAASGWESAAAASSALALLLCKSIMKMRSSWRKHLYKTQPLHEFVMLLALMAAGQYLLALMEAGPTCCLSQSHAERSALPCVRPFLKLCQKEHAQTASRSGVQSAGAAAASGRKLLGESRIFICQNGVIVGGPPTHSSISLIPNTALLMSARF